MKDLSELKIGDKVWVTGNGGVRSHVERVKRFTKTLIITETEYAHRAVEHRYDKISGTRKGTDRWVLITLEPFTEGHQEILNQSILKANIDKALSKLDNLNKSDKLTSDTLEKLNNVLEEIADED